MRNRFAALALAYASRYRDALPAHLLLLALLSSLVFFIQLGGSRLWDVDEAIFAETAREMYERGDAIVPYFNGQLFSHKPPLMYWGMMAAFQILGVSELAARSSSAIFGIASVLATYVLGRRLFSPLVGLLAGIILCTCLQFAVISRAATPDAPLVLFTALAMLAFTSGTTLFSRAPRDGDAPAAAPLQTSWLGAILAYAAMAVGALAKGPVAIVLPVTTWGLFLLTATFQPLAAGAAGAAATLAGRLARLGQGAVAFCGPARVWRALWQLRPLLGLAVILLVAGPWYVLVGWKTDGQWLAEFFGVHNLGRFWQPMDNHRGSVVYYLLAVLFGMFPWSIFLSPMSLYLVRRVRTSNDGRSGDLLLACWAVVWVGFFSLASTKLPSYVAPAYPALALIAARFLQQWLAAPQSISRGLLNASFAVLGITGVATAVVLPLVLESFLTRQHEYAWGLVGVPLALAALVAWRAAQQDRPRRAIAAIAAASAMFVTTVLAFGARRVDEFQTTPSVAAMIRQHAGDEAPVITSFHFFRPSFVYYTGRPVGELKSPAAAREFFETHPANAFLITTEVPFELLQQHLPPDVKILDVWPRFPRPKFPYRDNMVLLGRRGEPSGPCHTADAGHSDGPRSAGARNASKAPAAR